VFAPSLAVAGGYGLEWRVMIQLKNLSKTYSTRGVEHTALEDVSLTIEDGDIFGIIGISGAGKSTLVRCINLLEKPTSGSVVIDGIDVTAFDGRQLSNLRATIGMIFQDFNLFAQRTVLENVTFPLEIRGDDRADRERRGMELLDLVGLSAKAKQYPSQLSGGQQQRVSIARALANHPRVILCDEATSALDSLTTNSVLKLLRQINQEMGVTMVVITHEIGVVEKICNRVAVIDGSRIVEQGSAAEVLEDPRTDVTRRLLGRVRWDA
jgi:D-methionine transport system ATP-binding protein